MIGYLIRLSQGGYSNFQPIKIIRSSYSLNGFCSEPESKLAEIQIKHSQSVQLQKFWLLFFKFFETGICEKVIVFLMCPWLGNV